MLLPMWASTCLYIINGSFVCLLNCILIVCILSHPANRIRRDFLLITSQAMADIIYISSWILYVIVRVKETDDENISYIWSCSARVAFPFFVIATPLMGIIPMIVTMNFYFCTRKPKWYMKNTATWSYTISLMIVPLLLLTITLISAYTHTWQDQYFFVWHCGLPKEAADYAVYKIVLLSRLISVTITVIIYLEIVRYFNMNRDAVLGPLTQYQKNLYRNAFTTMEWTTRTIILFLLIPDLLLYFNPWQLGEKLATVLYLLTINKSLFSFFIYMCRHAELPRALSSKKTLDYPPSASTPSAEGYTRSWYKNCFSSNAIGDRHGPPTDPGDSADLALGICTLPTVANSVPLGTIIQPRGPLSHPYDSASLPHSSSLNVPAQSVLNIPLDPAELLRKKELIVMLQNPTVHYRHQDDFSISEPSKQANQKAKVVENHTSSMEECPKAKHGTETVKEDDDDSTIYTPESFLERNQCALDTDDTFTPESDRSAFSVSSAPIHAQPMVSMNEVVKKAMIAKESEEWFDTKSI